MQCSTNEKPLHSTQSTKLTSTQHHDSAEACEDEQFQFKTLLHPACSKQVRVPGTLFERRVTRIVRACVHAMTPALIRLVSQFSSQSQVQTTTTFSQTRTKKQQVQSWAQPFHHWTCRVQSRTPINLLFVCLFAWCLPPFR